MSIIREQKSNSDVRLIFKPSKVEETQTDIAPVDLKGFDSVLFTAFVGKSTVDLGADNQVYIELQHADIVDDKAAFTACSDAEVKGFVNGAVIDDKAVTGTFVNIRKAIPRKGLAFAASYTGPKRYVKPVIRCIGDGHGGDDNCGTEIAIGAMLQGAKYLPVINL